LHEIIFDPIRQLLTQMQSWHYREISPRKAYFSVRRESTDCPYEAFPEIEPRCPNADHLSWFPNALESTILFALTWKYPVE
jgi:hypothetical protein